MSTIFIHRRDLRLEDNLSLFKALSCSECVLPVFIFDPRQTKPETLEHMVHESRHHVWIPMRPNSAGMGC